VATGATAGHIGAAWGWYLLSPKWAAVLPSASAPVPYTDKTVTKHVIFLTDGIFNTSYKNGPATDDTTQMNESYAQFQSLCTNMKAQGITVYTVALDLLDPRALTELATCGGANSYTAADAVALKAVFQQIVSQLNHLRVAS
ncbi:MAG: VWA domain-containing protein, partial [Hyphomicrobiaceae bacterium]